MKIEDVSTITIDELKALYKKHNGVFNDVFNLGAFRDGDHQSDDFFNDVLFCTFKNKIYFAMGTVDPGWKATLEKKGGAAHIDYGFHKDIYIIGMHPNTETPQNKAFRHEAFVQQGNKVRIFRDLNRDGQYQETEPVMVDYFGLNRHRASIHGSDHIGLYSEGCTVHQRPETLARELDFAKQSGLTKFSTIIFDKSEYRKKI